MKLKTWWKRITARRVPMEPREAMKEQQLNACFRGGPTLPMWKGFMELIDNHFMESVNLSLDPSLSAEATKYHLGGADRMAALKEEAMRRMADAAKDEKDEDAA